MADTKCDTGCFNTKRPIKSMYSEPQGNKGPGASNGFRASQDPAMKEMRDTKPMKQG